MFNRTFTITHRERISQAKKGITHSQATKDKISASLKARWAEVPPKPETKVTEPTRPTQPTTAPTSRGTK